MQRSGDRQCTTFLVSRRPQPSLDGRTAISAIIIIAIVIVIIITVAIVIAFIVVIVIAIITAIIIALTIVVVIAIIGSQPSLNRGTATIYAFVVMYLTNTQSFVHLYLINTQIFVHLSTSVEYQLVPSPTPPHFCVCSNLCEHFEYLTAFQKYSFCKVNMFMCAKMFEDV